MATMRKYNINAKLVCTIEKLYDKTTSAVQMKSGTAEWFRTTAGDRKGCLLSLTLFNIILERIMSDSLKDRWMGEFRFYVLFNNISVI